MLLEAALDFSFKASRLARVTGRGTSNPREFCLNFAPAVELFNTREGREAHELPLVPAAVLLSLEQAHAALYGKKRGI
jgi:hypothetical protein